MRSLGHCSGLGERVNTNLVCKFKRPSIMKAAFVSVRYFLFTNNNLMSTSLILVNKTYMCITRGLSLFNKGEGLV